MTVSNKPTTAALTFEEASNLAAPTDAAIGLPGRVYFSPEFFDLERRTLFANGWVGAAFASIVPEPGDVAPISIADWELLLVRDMSGNLACFHNVCRHRGMRLVSAPGNLRNIRCPYHSWTYNHSGQLISTPSIGGIGISTAAGIDPPLLGLIPVRCGEWLGVVFVNVSATASNLSDHLAPVIERLERSFDLSLLNLSLLNAAGEQEDITIDANWKIIVEGTVEDYHLPFVHSTLGYDQSYAIEDGGRIYTGFSYKRSLSRARARFGMTTAGHHLPVFPAFERTGEVETPSLTVFPNVKITSGADHIGFTVWHPLSPGKTRISSQTRYIGEAATDPQFKPLRQAANAVNRLIIGEDRDRWEALQKTARTRDDICMGTRFSPKWEVSLHSFQKYVAEAIMFPPWNGKPGL